MSKYIDADKLKAHIEAIMEILWDRLPLEGLIDDLDSLQQEQQEVDLEKEIDACWQNWISPSNQSSVEGVLPKSEFSMYARHFYELGLNARKEESK